MGRSFPNYLILFYPLLCTLCIYCICFLMIFQLLSQIKVGLQIARFLKSVLFFFLFFFFDLFSFQKYVVCKGFRGREVVGKEVRKWLIGVNDDFNNAKGKDEVYFVPFFF